MKLKLFAYLDLWQPFCSAEQNHLCNFGRGYLEEQFCEIILNFDQWYRGRFHVKILYLELWQPSCLVEQNHLCHFERRNHGNHLYEVI